MQRKIQPQCKEFWMPNGSTKSCFKCDRGFTAFRRKHHCRYCGLIFCASCCKKKTALGNNVVLERCCEGCLHSISKDVLEFPVLEASDSSEDSEEEPLDQLVSETEPAEKFCYGEKPTEVLLEMFEGQWNHQLDKFFGQRVAALGLRKCWEGQSKGLVTQAVATVCPSTWIRHDSMDINEYVRVLQVIGATESSKFVKGVVIQKNAVHRKMRMLFRQPQVLFLQGGTEYFECDSKLVSMEKLISQESDFTDIIVKKLKRSGANIVINEKSISQHVVEKLNEAGISALSLVEGKLLNLLARSTQGAVLESVDRVSNTVNCLGSCERLKQKTMGGKNYIYFKDLPDCTLAGSIIVTGADSAELTVVAGVLRKLLVQYRNLLLEKCLYSRTGLRFVPELFAALSSEQFTYLKITMKNYKMCAGPVEQTVQFYLKGDCSLGDFVFNTLKEAEEPCSYDGTHTNSAHKTYYMKASGRIKVSSARVAPTNSTDITLSKHCKACMGRTESSVVLSKASREYSFHKFLKNLFVKADFLHESGQCRHDYFKFCKYTLQYQSQRVFIEFEENISFDIKAVSYRKDISGENTRLCKEIFFEFQIAAKDTFETLALHCSRLCTEASGEESADWNALREELVRTEEQLAVASAELNQLDIGDYEDQLSISALKRTAFFRACHFKLVTERLKQNIKKLRVGGKLEGPEFSYKSTLEGLDKEDELLNSPQFNQLKEGNMTLPLGLNGTCALVDEQDSLSIIAYALNSTEYHAQVLSKLPDCEIPEVIETELLRGNEEHFTHNFTTYDTPELNEVAHRPEIRKIYGSHILFQVKVYFPRQFHCTRLSSSGTHHEFLTCISSSEREILFLGKKGVFKFSHDKKYIMKTIESKEFNMFIDIAPNYFRHLCKSLYHSMPSKLVSTFGAFKVKVKNQSTGRNRTDLILIARNLLFGMPKGYHIYDLKGTSNSRRRAKEGDGRTKMDLNFLEEFHGLPVCLPQESKKLLDTSIWNDTIFLAKQNIVDYSLLIAVSLEHKQIAVGIIDYIEQYTFEKALEYRCKKYMNENPTILNTKEYRDRFRNQVLSYYFAPVDDL